MSQNQICLRPRQVAATLGIAVSTLWVWAKNEGFPKPLKLGERTTVWRMSEIQAYVDAQAAKRSTAK